MGHYLQSLLKTVCCVVLMMIIWSCNRVSNIQQIKFADTLRRSEFRLKPRPEALPSEAFIRELHAVATDIAKLSLIQIDSVAGARKIFKAKVLKVYQGGLKPMDMISYAGFSELNYEKRKPDTLVGFLVKHKRALKDIRNFELFYSTAERNATPKYSVYLDSLLYKIIAAGVH